MTDSSAKRVNMFRGADNGGTGLMAALMDVYRFHKMQNEACVRQGVPIEKDPVVPTAPSDAVIALRKNLHNGENKEMVDALDAGDLVEIFDAGMDIIWVTLGTMLSCGLGAKVGDAWNAVCHANNDGKIFPDGHFRVVDATASNAEGTRSVPGRVLKPAGWQDPQPRLQELIMELHSAATRVRGGKPATMAVNATDQPELFRPRDVPIMDKGGHKHGDLWHDTSDMQTKRWDANAKRWIVVD